MQTSPKVQPLRVSLSRFQLRRNSLPDLLDAMGQVVEEATRRESAMVVFPEIVNLGMATSSEIGAQSLADSMVASLNESDVNLLRSELSRHATHYQLWIFSGTQWFVGADGGRWNTGVWLGPDGASVEQRKLHVTSDEELLRTNLGSVLETITIGDVSIAVLICYDIEFPEVARAAAMRGAEVLVCPSLTYDQFGAGRVSACAAARAVENQCFVLTAPLVGSLELRGGDRIRAVGRTGVYAPINKRFGSPTGLLASLDGAAGGMLTYDLDIELLRASRRSQEAPTLRHARPDLYRAIRE